MTALKFLPAGGAAAAALISAAPAAAQYYPGYPTYPGNPGYGYPGYGNPVGPGPGYNNPAVNQCVAAVQARLNGGYGGYGDYGYNGYGYGGARVLGISRVEPRSSGGLTVRGVANSGRYAGAYGYNGQQPVDLTFKCKTDYRGFVTDVDIERAQSNYGYNYQPYSNYGTDYSQYGYRRY
jgi:hypothetical protein